MEQERRGGVSKKKGEGGEGKGEEVESNPLALILQFDHWTEAHI